MLQGCEVHIKNNKIRVYTITKLSIIFVSIQFYLEDYNNNNFLMFWLTIKVLVISSLSKGTYPNKLCISDSNTSQPKLLLKLNVF